MSKQFVVFTLNSQKFCVDIEFVSEITVLGNVTPVPNSNPFVEGVLNLRGKVIPLIKLSKVFGIREEVSVESNQIIVLYSDGRFIGMIVDTAQDVKIFDDKNIENTEGLLNQAEKFITGIIKDQGDLIQIVSVELLLEKCKEAS